VGKLLKEIRSSPERDRVHARVHCAQSQESGGLHGGEHRRLTQCAIMSARLRFSVRELRELARRVPTRGWACQLGRAVAGPGVLVKLRWSIDRSDCRALKTVAMTAACWSCSIAP
jgi:hypothetical protein